MIKGEYYLVREGKRLRLIEQKKVMVDRNTPAGDDSNYYEIKPYGGKKQLDVVGILTEHDFKDFHVERFELCDIYGRSMIIC